MKKSILIIKAFLLGVLDGVTNPMLVIESIVWGALVYLILDQNILDGIWSASWLLILLSVGVGIYTILINLESINECCS